VVISGIGSHSAAGDAILAECDTRRDTFLAEGPVAVVPVEFVGLRVIGDEEIGPTVVVVIEHGDTERFAGRVAYSGLCADILEPASTEIVVQLRRGSLVRFGGAVGLAGAIE